MPVDAKGMPTDRIEITHVTIRDTPPEPFVNESVAELGTYKAVLDTSSGPIAIEFFTSSGSAKKSCDACNRAALVSALTPGMFSEDRSGQRVYFVETLSRDGLHISNVFVQAMQQGRLGVITASKGKLEI